MSNSEFGSDGQIHDTAAEKPLENLAAREEEISADQFEASEPGSAAQRLRAFEDEHLGPDAVRLHGGRVERGSGSLLQGLPAEKQKVHAALEKAVETERKVDETRAKLAAAENEHNAALAAAEDASRFGG